MIVEKERIKQDYNASAEIYNSRYSDIQREKYETMLSNFTIKETDKILDLGSGTGMLSAFLNKKLIGIDLSLNMLKKGSKQIALQGDTEKLPFKDSTFDIIMSFTCLQNLEHPKKSLKEMYRVLKKNGKVILTFLEMSVIKNKRFIPDHDQEVSKEILDESSDVIVENISNYFDVQEIMLCGEDIGFILVKKDA